MLLDSNKNNRITEFDDIVSELVKEKNIPYKEMEEICKLSIEYIKRLTDDKETLSIVIPELGNLYYSERLGEFHKKRVENFSGRNVEEKKVMFDFYEHKSQLIKSQEELNNNKKSYHRRKPLLYKFKNIYKKLFGGKIVRMGATLGYQELWTKFSEIQNNIQNGKKNNFT